MATKIAICLLAVFIGSSLSGNEFVPDAFLAEYCFDCHDDLTQKGEIRLDDAIDREWSDRKSLAYFEQIKKVIASGDMPPADESHRPSDEERAEVTEWLHEALLENSEVGGTVLRRLNRNEYERTIQRVMGFSYDVPEGFPADQHYHGFDNIGKALVLSPTLMESYANSAAEVADKLFPPASKPVESSVFTASPEELVISYSSGYVVDGAMRIASKSSPVSRSCTWPTKFEAEASGVYRLKLDLSTLGDLDGAPFELQVRAKQVSESDGVGVETLRLLTSFEVTSETATAFEEDVQIYEGETIILYFANAVLDSDRGDAEAFREYLTQQFAANSELLAGWLAVELNQGLRGGVGWERVKAKMDALEEDFEVPAMDSPEVQKLIETMGKNPVQYVESISYQLFEEGPALGIHHVEVEGPFEAVEDDDDRARKRWQAQFFGSDTLDAETAQPEVVFEDFLTRAFRRPAEPGEVAAYSNLVKDHVSKGHSREEAFHLALRTILISPQFLYRESEPGKLDDWGLASRLSYFLTGGPPDETLVNRARDGKLSDPSVLEYQTTRLLKGTARPFADQFTSQWLGTRLLSDIMPDPRLGNFRDSDRDEIVEETELFFHEILKENLPIATFIQPDFTFLNQNIARKIYGRSDVKSQKMTKVSLEEDGPYGGILGQASVMMATANGVDTQPVLRGIWVLENVLGDPPPPPPTNVPAITPDTRGAKTVRDLLEAHRDDEACFRCHQKIDPLGYVLENFDPVGRWRTHYPFYDERGREKPGAEINANGETADGHPLSDVNDLKAYVMANLDDFGECLAEKLLMYATGRDLSYADREAIIPIVRENLEVGAGFQDLIVALVKSDVFRTK